MKGTALIAAALISMPAFAANKVFNAEATYTKAGWGNGSKFNALEQMGVERTAERKALSACMGSGATDCVILEGAYITKCNYGYDLNSTGCTATANARGVQ